MYKFKECLPFISKNKISSFSTKSYKGNIKINWNPSYNSIFFFWFLIIWLKTISLNCKGMWWQYDWYFVVLAFVRCHFKPSYNKILVNKILKEKINNQISENLVVRLTLKKASRKKCAATCICIHMIFAKVTLNLLLEDKENEYMYKKNHSHVSSHAKWNIWSLIIMGFFYY